MSGQGATFDVTHPMQRMLAVLGLLVLGLVAAGSLTTITGTVMMRGIIVTSDEAAVVTLRTGGTITTLSVREGDAVEQDQVLFTLDATATERALSRLESQRAALRVREARLKSAAENKSQMAIPQDLALALTAAGLDDLLASERKLFDEDRSALATERLRLRRDQIRLRSQAHAIDEQIRAKEQEIEIISRDIDASRRGSDGTEDQLKIRDLRSEAREVEQRILALERDRARLMGELQRLKAARSEALSDREDRERRLERLDADERRRALTELSDITTKLHILSAEAQGLQSEIAASSVRAPKSGTVRNLMVESTGARVEANAPVMSIVSKDEHLLVEAALSERDAQAALPGMRAIVRLQAASRELRGRVARISGPKREANSTRPGAIVRIVFDLADGERLRAPFDVPGTPVDVVIETETRSTLAYLLRPLADALRGPAPR